MNDESLKLAKETGALIGNNLEAFYKAAFNAGIEAACKPVRDRMIGYAVDDSDLKRLEQDIKALKIK